MKRHTKEKDIQMNKYHQKSQKKKKMCVTVVLSGYINMIDKFVAQHAFTFHCSTSV